MKLFGKKFTRRNFVQGAGAVGGAGLLGLNWAEALHSQSQARASATGDPPRALALVGDRFHNSDYIRVALDKTFKELSIPIDYTVEYDKISASVLKNYRLFLCLRDGMIWPGGYLGPDAWSDYSKNLENAEDYPNQKAVMWMTEDQGAAIKDFVTAGNGFYALHNSSHISLTSKNYREVMGGAYISHPPLRPFRVRPTENKHPITEGITEFMVNDEQHYVDYDKDKKYILLEAENVDGLTFQTYGTKSISGWAYDFGGGRVVFTAVGHTIHAMWAPQYLEIQKRSVQWLLKLI
jgi:type 1 glutamine amidotransferase